MHEAGILGVLEQGGLVELDQRGARTRQVTDLLGQDLGVGARQGRPSRVPAREDRAPREGVWAGEHRLQLVGARRRAGGARIRDDGRLPDVKDFPGLVWRAHGREGTAPSRAGRPAPGRPGASGGYIGMANAPTMSRAISARVTALPGQYWDGAQPVAIPEAARPSIHAAAQKALGTSVKRAAGAGGT